MLKPKHTQAPTLAYSSTNFASFLHIIDLNSTVFIWCESESILKKIYLPNPQILKITFSSNKVSLNDRYLKINTFFARIYVVGGPLHTPFRYLIRRLISRLHWIFVLQSCNKGIRPWQLLGNCSYLPQVVSIYKCRVHKTQFGHYKSGDSGHFLGSFV